jgi:poly(3-hydroxybutyrate) depolymerase
MKNAASAVAILAIHGAEDVNVPAKKGAGDFANPLFSALVEAADLTGVALA